MPTSFSRLFRWLVCFLVLGFMLTAGSACCQATPDSAPHGSLTRVKVHGKSLEGNLEGDSPDRDVSIYLPPSYTKEKRRRYPVLYLLHGFTDKDNEWFGNSKHFVNATAAADHAFAAGTGEMILVMPNAYTLYQGSMYSTSATTGDWESYISQELVAFVDSHYRTIAEPASRGLAGHSMGGYGTIRIGIKHPEVFSSIYAMSACCLSTNMTGPTAEAMKKMEAVHSPADLSKADFLIRAAFAMAAAWSPDPKNPPLFLDLPEKNGEFQPQVAARWAANAPVYLIDQYITNVRRLHGIAFDVGTKDFLVGNETTQILDRILTNYSIPHTYDTYDGDHVNRIGVRLEQIVIPFFGKNLSYKPVRK